MRMGNVLFKVILVALLALFVSSSLFAATTGKIRGTVYDKKTKEPVPGAIVMVDGTSMGAQAGPDGDFIIINVPPKLYSLVASNIGYIKVKMENVQVNVDRTTNADFWLQPSIVELDEIQIVTAERDLLQVGITSNQTRFTAESIKNMPVTNVQDLIKAQSGVVERFGELHIRGGRANETIYIVDGVEIKDPLGRGGALADAMNISGNAVQDMQIIKGGFSAEYGGATSGIINVTTKSGTKVTTGHIEYFTDDFGTEKLNKKSRNYDRLEFNMSGPEPWLADRLLPVIGIDWFKNKLSYAVVGSIDKQDGYLNYQDYGTSSTVREFKSRSILGLFNLTDRRKNNYEASIKLNWQAAPAINVVFNYRRTWDDYTGFEWSYRYTPQTASISNNNTSRISIRMTHNLNTSTFYDLTLSRVSRKLENRPGDPNNPGEGVDPDEIPLYTDWENFFDRNSNGVFDAQEPFVNANGDTSWFWGGPFYTYGDAYLAPSEFNLWPILDYEYGQEDPTTGSRTLNPEYRGVSVSLEGLSSGEPGIDTILTDWNGNGIVDFYESEPFADMNGDGRWTAGDYLLSDTNNDGIYNAERRSNINIDSPEPYVDGDRVIGEPFTDVNNNNTYDPGIDIFLSSTNPGVNQDLNYNSEYDGPLDKWSPGVPFEDLNGNGIFDAKNQTYDPGEPFLDLNGNGKWDQKDGFYDYGYDQWARYVNRESIIWTANFSINKQFNKEHEVKSGVQIEFDDITQGDLQYPWIPYDGIVDGGPFPDRGVFRDFYSRNPINGSFFIQDKMEYGAMIANIGLRYDFFIQSADLKTSASEDQLSSKSIEGSKNKFSPRIGFSYPISDKAKVYFNYGHFYQLPELRYLYRRATQGTSAFGIIGNENLDYKKTIQYAFGVTYQLSDDYVLDVSGFYKDIFGDINSVRRSYGPVSRNEYSNLDYARARGLEAELRKNYGNYVSGYTAYAYSFAYGKSSSEASNYFDDFYSRAISISENPLNWDVRHQITLNLDLSIPRGDHPYLFGLKLPDNWGFNVLWQFNSGFPFTPDKDFPGILLLPGEDPQVNSMRYPASSKVDLRAYKRFPLMGLSFTVDFWIENLFDKVNIDFIYGTTGRYDTNSKPIGANYVFGGTDLAKDPSNLGEGRNIRLGIGVDF